MEKFIIAFTVAVLAVSVWAMYEQGRQWNLFRVEHHCKKVGETGSTVGTGISTSGKVVTTVNPGQTGWLCNDGITYWR